MNQVDITCDKCQESHTVHFDNPVRLARLEMLSAILSLKKYRIDGSPYLYICVDDILEDNQDLQGGVS